MRRLMVKEQHLADYAQALRYFLEYREGRVQFRLLRHVSQPQTGSAPQPAIIRPCFARKNTQQARLAAAIPADQTDALRGIKLQTHVVEQRMMAEGEAGVFESEKRHGCESTFSKIDEGRNSAMAGRAWQRIWSMISISPAQTLHQNDNARRRAVFPATPVSVAWRVPAHGMNRTSRRKRFVRAGLAIHSAILCI